MKRKAVFILAFLVLTLVFSSVVSAEPLRRGKKDSKDKTVELQILGINDYHGHIQANTPGTIDGQPAGGFRILVWEASELRKGHQREPDRRCRRPHRRDRPLFPVDDEPSVESLN